MKKNLVYLAVIPALLLAACAPVFEDPVPSAPAPAGTTTQTVAPVSGATEAVKQEGPAENFLKSAGEACTAHSQCITSVCDFEKQDSGKCASAPCKAGELAGSNEFFCNDKGVWEKAKEAGTACGKDYECKQSSCANNPTCSLSGDKNSKTVCENSVCVKKVAADECSLDGKTKILRKDQFFDTEGQKCVQSLAQMELPTVCAACGNGVCDQDLESTCNCPADCKE